ncbi:MAG: O-antigen ligase family protein [Bacteroidales bacterium]
MYTFPKYNEVIRKINFFLLVLISFSIPFHRLFAVYLCALWIIFSLMEGDFFKKISRKNEKGYLLLFILFYALHIIGMTYSENTKAAKIDIILKIPFIIMPFLFSLSGDYLREKKNKILLSFVAGNLLASVICLIAATVRSFSVVNGTWVFNAELMDHNYSFWQMLANGGNNFMYEPLSIFHHSGYFSVYIVISVLLLLDMLVHKEIGKSMHTKVLYILLILFFCIMVYLLFARTGLIALFIVLLGYSIYVIFKSKIKIYTLGLLIIITIAGVVIIGHNNRIKNSFNEIKKIIYNSNKRVDSDNRLFIWFNSLEIIKNNLFTGVGTGDNKNKLLEIYKEKKMEKAEKARLNVHNQFLETTIQLGLPGLLVLLAIFILPFIRAVKNRNILLMCFLIVNGMFFFFESCLNTQAGVVFFSFFYSLLVFIPKYEKTENYFSK